MNVLSILGSPRAKGNSATLANHLTGRLQQQGAAVETHILNKLDYKGCQSCYACKTTSERCVVKDDISPILDAMHGSDVIVMASPNFYGHISGQMKLFLDRTFSLLTPEFETGINASRLAPGKHLVFIFTQGADKTMFTDVIPKFGQLKQYYGFEEIHTLHGCELNDANDAAKQPELLDRAGQIAKNLWARIS